MTVTVTELNDLLDIHYRAFEFLEESGLIIVSKDNSVNIKECEYLIKDPVEDTYLQVICKDGEFVVCGDVWQGITLNFSQTVGTDGFCELSEHDSPLIP